MIARHQLVRAPDGFADHPATRARSIEAPFD
jgi:hypothetical protein